MTELEPNAEQIILLADKKTPSNKQSDVPPEIEGIVNALNECETAIDKALDELRKSLTQLKSENLLDHVTDKSFIDYAQEQWPELGKIAITRLSSPRYKAALDHKRLHELDWTY